LILKEDRRGFVPGYVRKADCFIGRDISENWMFRYFGKTPVQPDEIARR